MYNILRRILFLFPAESIHYFSMNILKLVCRIGILRWLLAGFYGCKRKDLEVHLFHLVFKNPVGLGAGFDKNARYLRELETLGFGFVEIGTVTPLPQRGNEKPRLFRLPADNALINRMGFNNDGVMAVSDRLRKWRAYQDAAENRRKESGDAGEQAMPARMLVGGNIGKNKNTPNERAWKDYEICFKELHPYVDYFVVNVSSPNTPGLRELQEKDSLHQILRQLQMINNAKAISKPILLKIAPDLSQDQIDDVIDLALEIKLDGLVCTNTTINRVSLLTKKEKVNRIGAGGLSGKPLKNLSTFVVEYINKKTRGEIPVIASGGIFTVEDAKEKIIAGASLVQVWTGFIYEGPGMVKKICRKL